MAVIDTQIAINTSGTPSTVIGVSAGTRNFMRIQAYSTNTVSIFVSWDGTTATAGTGGELELVPGAVWDFGQSSGLNQHDSIAVAYCPQGAVSVVTNGTAATGNIWTNTTL